MAAEVERLEASGRKLKLVGNDLDNEILIGGIAKSIDGRGGDDRISLGEGKIPILGGTGGDRFTWRGLDGQLDTYATSRRARATCSISTPSYRPVLRPTRWHSSASPRRRAAPSSKSMSTARGVRSDGRRSSS
jgi:hypothetical protein